MPTKTKRTAAKKAVPTKTKRTAAKKAVPLAPAPLLKQARPHVEAAAAMISKAAIADVEAFYDKRAAKPAPKQARVYPTLQAWLAHPDHALRLKQIISDPVFVAACHYVEGMVGVTPDDLVGAKAELSEVIVRKAAIAAGAKTFVTLLTALPDFRKVNPAANPEPWEHIQAPLTR